MDKVNNSDNHQREALKAEIATVRGLLAMIPEELVIDRASLTSRIEHLETRLRGLTFIAPYPRLPHMETTTVSFISASKLFADCPKACELFNDAFPYTFGDGDHTLHTARTVLRCLEGTCCFDDDEKAQVEAVKARLATLGRETLIDLET